MNNPGHAGSRPLRSRLGRRSFIKSGATAAAGLLGAVLVGCDDEDPGESATRRGGVLRMGQSVDLSLEAGHPFALIPQNRILFYASSETLIEYREDLTPTLLLAERFELNEDHTRLSATLKADLEFHNGAPVTSEDVLFGIELLQDPLKYDAPGATQLSAFAQMVSATKIIDKRSFELEFDQPRTNIADFFAQLPITHAASWQDQLSDGRPIGTGPFQFKSREVDSRYELERFVRWHGGGESRREAYLDGIEVLVYPDQPTAGFAFEAQQLDSYFAMSASVAMGFQEGQRTRLARKTGVNYLGLNTQHEQLADPRVRRAIFLAIDREFMARNVGHGFGGVTSQPWGEGSPAFDPALEAPLFDPGRAKALLSEAGFQQGEPLVLEYGAPVALQASEAALIQQNLKDVGIEVRLEASEIQSYVARYQNRQFPALWLAAHAFADLSPLTLLQQSLEFRPDNLSHYNPPELVEIRDSLQEEDPRSTESVRLYADLNRLWVEDPFIVPTGIAATRIDLVQPDVMGWPADSSDYCLAPTGKVDFSRIWLAREG